jgi:hypothetical protein
MLFYQIDIASNVFAKIGMTDIAKPAIIDTIVGITKYALCDILVIPNASIDTIMAMFT